MSEWGTGKVTGGKLYCRKQPIDNYAYWGRFDNNAIIPIKLHDNTWYETYWNGDIICCVSWLMASMLVKTLFFSLSSRCVSRNFTWFSTVGFPFGLRGVGGRTMVS